jgi:hypothetical protein
VSKSKKWLVLGAIISAVGITAAFLLLWSRYSPSDFPQARRLRALHALERAQPSADAADAAARGDYRLVAISGYAPIIPVPQSVEDRVMKGLCDYRFIPFTYDAGDELTLRSNGVAWKYAKQYNALLLDRVGVDTVCPTTPRLARENGARAVLADEFPPGLIKVLSIWATRPADMAPVTGILPQVQALPHRPRIPQRKFSTSIRSSPRSSTWV